MQYLQKFKQTELGLIPEEWEIKKLSDIGQIVGGGTPDTTKKDYWENGSIAWAVPTDLTSLKTNYISKTERYITKKGLENSAAKLLPEGSILITSRATIGECAITIIPITTNQGFQNLICNSKNNNLFLLYVIKFNKEKLVRKSHGTTFLEISKNNIKNLKLPIPPFKEQQKIASILSNVDELIQKTEQVIEQTQRLKKGLINKLIIQGIDVKNNLYQQIPEKHQYRKLTEVVKVNPSHKLEKDKEYAFVEMAAINEKTKSISYCIKRKPSSGYAIFKNYDTLFARITPCIENGKICLVKDIDGYGIGSTELIVLNPGNEILPEFLCYYCQTDKVRNHAISQMGGATGRQRVPYKVFTEDLFILLPTKEIQEKIVNCIKTIEEIIKLKTDEKKQIQNLKKGLMQQLLTGKIRVKV
jgi:type I restriction enzyme S subunit